MYREPYYGSRCRRSALACVTNNYTDILTDACVNSSISSRKIRRTSGNNYYYFASVHLQHLNNRIRTKTRPTIRRVLLKGPIHLLEYTVGISVRECEIDDENHTPPLFSSPERWKMGNSTGRRRTRARHSR